VSACQNLKPQSLHASVLYVNHELRILRSPPDKQVHLIVQLGAELNLICQKFCTLICIAIESNNPDDIHN
jgi:hypothetical protein